MPFFDADNGSAPSYTIVAVDLDHAKRILRTENAHGTYDDAEGREVPFEQADLTWTEISSERAHEIMVHGNDGKPDPRPLDTFEPGDWFCSEW